MVAVLNCRRDLLSSGSGLGGEFPGVPAGLLVHKPGVSGPDEHVEEAEHLAEQHRGGGGDKTALLKGSSSKLFRIYPATTFKTVEMQLI